MVELVKYLKQEIEKDTSKDNTEMLEYIESISNLPVAYVSEDFAKKALTNLGY
tara:strand:- start:55 stop:213 length:159 start_codon:yes stop_codon:yes gene_type:complete